MSSYTPPTNGGESSRQGAKKYAKRPYAHACQACKARKIKCEEADAPPCKGCRASNLLCELPERAVRRKRNPTNTASSSRARTPAIPLTIEDRLKRIEEVLRIDYATPYRRDSQDVSEASDVEEEKIQPPQFHLGGDDHPVYHGETSMHEVVSDLTSLDPTRVNSINPRRLDGSWTEEELRSMTRSRHKYASPDEGESFMDASFCWASVTYGVINRSIFLRDMALGGPMFSQLLLVVLYLSGLRFSPNIGQKEREEKGSRYMAIANSLITEELGKPSSIPTAQALLTLAGRQCAVGQQTSAWLVTGLAIRMIQDLGIHLAIDDPSLDAHFPQEMKEMRVRLYWSAYTWDKSISLGMGREPALTCRPDSFPEVKLNERDDNWIWKPYFPDDPNFALQLRYPETSSRTSYALRYFSQLCMILESILVNMYSPHRPNARSVSFIRSTHERLRAFRQIWPEDLRLDRSRLPEFCPPTNITVPNLLYHAMQILLYRPLLNVRGQSSAITTSSFEICRSAAIDIHGILSLWKRTFGNVNMVYMVMYCTFVAAGIDVILLRLADGQTREEALKRVHLSLSILEQASDQGPGIRRGIAIIASQLQAATLRQNTDTTTSGGINLAPAESSMRMHPPQPAAKSLINDTNGDAGIMPNIFSAKYDFAQPSDLNGQVDGMQDSSAEFLALFDDPSHQQAIAELLGENNVGTDDPFAFFTGEGWGESTF